MRRVQVDRTDPRRRLVHVEVDGRHGKIAERKGRRVRQIWADLNNITAKIGVFLGT